MRNSIDFKAQFYCEDHQLSFIHCFSSAYVHLEKIGGKIAHECERRPNSGCNAHRIWEVFYSMSGAVCERRRYDGEPSEVQKKVGSVNGEYYGNDDTADFLFGFAGYGYRKLTDPAAFKTAVIESIDSGKPVIAKIKSQFHLITGYDGDVLIVPDYAMYFPINALEYGGIEKMFIFGDKEEPRYKLRDAFARLADMMEMNADEKIWDSYIDAIRHDFLELRDEDFAKLTPDKQKAVFPAIHDAMVKAWNAWTFAGCMYYNRLSLHAEMQKSAYKDIFQKIHKHCCWLTGFCNSPMYAIENMDLTKGHVEVGWIFISLIERSMKFDAELLDLIKQAIEIMDKE